MIFNLSAGDNTSEEVEVMLTQLETEINTLMTELKSDVGNMLTQLTDTINNLSFGAVKSIQSGILNADTATSKYEEFRVANTGSRAYYVDVTINEVTDINKCFIHTNTTALAIPKLINNTTLRIYVSGGNGDYTNYFSSSAINWQVIEFY